MHQATALEAANWVVLQITLPPGLLQIVDEWQALRESAVLQRIRRGMHMQTQYIDQGMEIRGPIPVADSPEHFGIWVVPATYHAPASYTQQMPGSGTLETS